MGLVSDFLGFSSDLVTVELTFASDGITEGGLTPLFAYATDEQDDAFTLYVQEFQSKMKFRVNGSAVVFAQGAVVDALFDGAPHHIAVTYDSVAGKAQVFFDGLPPGSLLDFAQGQVGDGSDDLGGTFFLGQEPDNEIEGDYGFNPVQIFSREISDVRVYDDIRTQNEILLDMITPLDPAALPGELAHAWQMRVGSDLVSGNDLVGGKHLDISTNENGVTLNESGDTDYTVVSTFDGFSSAELTVEMTFSSGPLPTIGAVPLLSYGTSTQADAFTVVAEADAANGDKLSLIVSGEQQTLAQGQAVTDLFDGATHHFALTWNSTTGVAAVYVDGALIGAAGFTPGTVESGGTFLLGQRIEDVDTADYFTDDQFFQGTIYEVRIYDDVRTQEQIFLDMVTPLDVNNLPVRLQHAWQFLTTAGVASGDDLIGGKDFTISV